MYKFNLHNFAPFLILLLFGAENLSGADLKITPPYLYFTGETGSLVNRTLFLEVDSSIHLTFIPLDLIGSDENEIFPASSIKLDNRPDSFLIHHSQPLVVQIDLHQIVPGEYHGPILIRTPKGSHPIPVKIRVKDSISFPILVYIIGIILGLAVLFFYGQQSARDKILIRSGEIRSVIKTESELIPPFREQIDAYQDEIESLIHSENWDEANHFVTIIETLWNRWRQGRSDWIVLFQYHLGLKQKIENLNLNRRSLFLIKTAQIVDEVIKNAPHLENSAVLAEKLANVSQQLNFFIQLQNEIEELNRLRSDIPGEFGEPWRAKILELQQQLDSLEPLAQINHENLQDEIKNTSRELKKLVHQHGLKVINRNHQAEMTSSRLMNRVPPLISKNFSPVKNKSAKYQKIFKYILLFLLGLLFGSIGFYQFYIVHPTFGANF